DGTKFFLERSLRLVRRTVALLRVRLVVAGLVAIAIAGRHIRSRLWHARSFISPCHSCCLLDAAVFLYQGRPGHVLVACLRQHGHSFGWATPYFLAPGLDDGDAVGARAPQRAPPPLDFPFVAAQIFSVDVAVFAVDGTALQ